MATDFAERRAKLFDSLGKGKKAGILVAALPNVRYLSGFTGSNAALLVTAKNSILFTDPRYQTQAPLESDCEVEIANGPLLPAVAASLKRLKIKTLGFERNRISYVEHQVLKQELGKTKLQPFDDAVETLRMVKSAAEIATIRASVELNSAALEEALRRFKPNMTEVDLAAEIEYRMRRLGADSTAFDTIVASGKRAALPHAHPTDNAIGANQLLLVDMGSRVAGYCSDMTRTHAVGKLTAKAREMYRAVLEAQLAAIDAVRPGVTCASVDQAARRVLRRFGMDKLFIHSTGHGLGLEIHESPRVGRKDRTKLEAGMCITIEPGVYDEATGGVRIEDTVVVTETGCDVLTPTPRELVSL